MAAKEIKDILDDVIKNNISVCEIITYENDRIYGVFTNKSEEEKAKLKLIRINHCGKYEFDFKENKWDHSEKDYIHTLITEVNPDRQAEKKTVVLIENIELIPQLSQFIREVNYDSENKYKNIFFIFINIEPFKNPLVTKDLYTIYLDLPDKELIEETLSIVYSDDEYKRLDDEDRLKLVNAALGLTIIEAERAFKLSRSKSDIEEKISLIVYEKENIIKRSGYLEYIHYQGSMEESVGGLEYLKKWLDKRKKGYDEEAKEIGIKQPNGIILVGIPGTGKSLVAKTIGNKLNCPILRLDFGKMFSSYIGSSESNIRAALNLTEAISPCVLWIDEIEKGVSGLNSSGRTDGGTTSRVISTFLTWLQEKQKPVFVVATSNNIEANLPPEFTRKGRFDEIFYLGYPNEKAREEIIKIHLKGKTHNLSEKDIIELAKSTRYYNGSELEILIQEALYNAYDKGKKLNYDILKDISDSDSDSDSFKIMYDTVKEQLKGIQAEHKKYRNAGEFEKVD